MARSGRLWPLTPSCVSLSKLPQKSNHTYYGSMVDKKLFVVFTSCKLKHRGASTLYGSASHVARQRDTPNADPNKKCCNRQLWGFAAIPKPAELMKEVCRRTNGSLIRADAVLAQEIILSATCEYFISQEKTDQFVEKCLHWLNCEFGEYLVSATLHMDETTPHIHAYVTAVTDGKLKNGRAVRRVSTSQLFTPQSLEEMHDRLAKVVEPLGLHRGRRKSKSFHEDIGRYHQRVNQGVRRATELYELVRLPLKVEPYRYNKTPRRYAEEVVEMMQLHYSAVMDAAKIATATVVELNAKLGLRDTTLERLHMQTNHVISIHKNQCEQVSQQMRQLVCQHAAQIEAMRSACAAEVVHIRQEASEHVLSQVTQIEEENRRLAARVNNAEAQVKQIREISNTEMATLRTKHAHELKDVTTNLNKQLISTKDCLAGYKEKHEFEIKEMGKHYEGILKELTLQRNRWQEAYENIRRSYEDINLMDFVSRLQFGHLSCSNSVWVWRHGSMQLELSPSGWRDRHSSKTGNSAIGMLMHITGFDLNDSILYLAERFSSEEVTAAVATWGKSVVTDVIVDEAIPKSMSADATAATKVREWLIAHLGASFDADRLFSIGALEARTQSLSGGKMRYWAVFFQNKKPAVLIAADNEPCARLNIGRQQYPGVIAISLKNPESIIFVDTPIELLACSKLNPNACIISGAITGIMAGNPVVEKVFSVYPQVPAFLSPTSATITSEAERVRTNLEMLRQKGDGRGVAMLTPPRGDSWANCLRQQSAKEYQVRGLRTESAPNENLSLWRRQQRLWVRSSTLGASTHHMGAAVRGFTL